MMKVLKTESKPRKSHVLTSVRNNGEKELMIIKFQRTCQTEKNVSSVFLKYILQRKRKENVFKIFTEEILQRAHHTLESTYLKISIPINHYFYLC